MSEKPIIYDVELNDDKDRVELSRRGRVAHRWTHAEAKYIMEELIKLVPNMKEDK